MSEVNIFGSDSEAEIISNFMKHNPEYNRVFKIRKIKFALSETQRRDLLETARANNEKHYILLRVGLETGMRVNELSNWAISDFNYQEKMLYVQSKAATQYTRVFMTKTLSSNRRIPLTAELCTVIRAHLGSRKTGYVFESQKKIGNYRCFHKNSVIRIANKYAVLCPSIGRTIGFHALRRTFASYLINNGVDITTISQLLGHSGINVTLRYLFTIDRAENHEEVRKVVETMNASPSNSPKKKKSKEG